MPGSSLFENPAIHRKKENPPIPRADPNFTRQAGELDAGVPVGLLLGDETGWAKRFHRERRSPTIVSFFI
jgi:hypothetical protein